MIIPTVGRYAVLLQLFVSPGGIVQVEAAPSSFRGAAAAISGGDGINGDQHHHRILQVCSSFGSRRSCRSNGCQWIGSSKTCIPEAPPPTNPPVTPAPTALPTNEPTTPPSPSPTASPAVESMGYCSDDVNRSCWTEDACVCGGAAATSSPGEKEASAGNPFDRRRALQSACDAETNRKRCLRIAGCAWVSKACVSTSSEPTDSPVTNQPTKFPTKFPTPAPTTNMPTGAPTPCACLGLGPTKSPTPEPTASPSSSPIKFPTGSPTLEPSGSPTKTPTPEPSNAPTTPPTKSPTDEPTPEPSSTPTKTPTPGPSNNPTTQPTKSPTDEPSKAPTDAPTKNPSKFPSVSPTTANPTTSPSDKPTPRPSSSPTDAPSKTPTDVPSNSPNGSGINGEIDVPIIPHPSDTLTVTLPPSNQGILITLSQVSADNDDALPVARSYDGNSFETLRPLLLPVNCDGGSCMIDIPSYSGQAAMHYILQEYIPQSKTTTQDFARLLLQGTYGPTQTSLSEAMAIGSAAGWVRDQMDKPASLLRAHYRRRANAYTKNDLIHMGVRVACEPGSRWNRHAFNRWLDVGKTIVEEDTGNGSYFLKVDGIVRTEVNTRPSVEFDLPSTTYVICRNTTVDENWISTMRMSSFVEAPTGEKGTLLVADSANACNNFVFTAIDMPAVFFGNPENIPSVNLVSMSDPNIIEAKVLQDISTSNCDDFKLTWPNFVRDTSSGLYYVEDRRAELYDNTDGVTTEKKRLLDGRCPRVPKTFLNEDNCAVRSDCSTPVFSGEFDLNAQNIRAFYEVDGKIVYRIQNLPLVYTPSPCATNNNRFVRKNAGGDGGGCSNDRSGDFPEIVAAIDSILQPMIASQQDSKRVIDISDTSIPCTDANDAALGASFTVTLPGSSALSCWTHTYNREWSVYVMNDWAVNHPGNPRFYRESKPNPISDIAEREVTGNLEDSVTLDYPPWGFHQYNFHNNRWRLDYAGHIGSWGDRISFNDLPNSAKSANVVMHLGGTVVAGSGELIEVCGSPGEVGNDSSFGSQYLLQKFGEADEERPDTLDQDHERWHSSQMIWNTVTLNAPDQLRHRVAWALASIFVVTQTDISFEDVSEPWSNYYDLFVRHAFGSSFFDLLKSVSFSPLMGMMLTYEGSKSLAYQIERNGASLYPDENFAREIMQLFSIGLYMLNEDGTKTIDETTGKPIPTYTNDDIVNFSRGWTNFFIREENRDNVEPEWSHGWVTNRVDPMTLPTSEARDVFPKQTLLVDGKRGYIGDQIPRCDAMPEKAWLRKGATWEFRENSQSLMGKQDPDWWADPETWTPRMILDPNTSSLYAKLCNFDGQDCDFKSTVVLNEDISCDGSCDAGQSLWDGLGSPTMPCECSIDEPRTVRIDLPPPLAPIWYEYKRAPCIQMAYPESGNMNSVKEIGAAGYGNKAMCADSRHAVAGTTCCDSGGTPVNICIFKGERTTYQTALDRCEAYGAGYSTCSWGTVGINWNCGTDMAYYQGDYSMQSSPGMRFSWTSEPCSMSAQIDQAGNVAIVHSVGSNSVKERVGVGTGTYFGALWEGAGTYPQASSNCDGICQVDGNTCLCAANAVTTQVFDGVTIPTKIDLVSQLFIGANDPNLYGDDKYILCSAPLCAIQEYNIYSRTPIESDVNFANAFDEETIFEVNDAGSSLFISNTKSIVDIGGSYSFRNPPMYNSPVDPTQRDGLYETDDILQNYANHPNTAPFIATKLIQHLVTSNPSPRYVKVVADAFKAGSYVSDGTEFGSGGYGDLGATVAAIMLESEARSATLDDDSNHGRAREPLLKIMHLYRSMNLSTSSGANREVDMVYLLARGIGQEAFRSPSVFSFFLSEYQPVGPVLNKGLVAPETQLFDAPKLIGFINGLFSLPLYGLADCEWWQGFGETRARYWLTDYPDGGYMNCWEASESAGVPLRLNWKPPSWGGATNVNGASVSSVIDEIDVLLTGGRLHSANRALLEQVYIDALAGSDPDNNALRSVLQHYSAVPEYHITNNLVDSSNPTTEIRNVPNITIPQAPPPVEGYKAIVYLFMAGACDSFSMLSPAAGCTPLHNQYLNVRGDVAIQSSDLLPIDASTSNQPCNTFNLHPSLVNIHGLYVGGDAAWVGNIGPLVEPLDKVEFDLGSKPVPQSLFAHNTQTQVTQAVFAQDGSAGGVLGRIGDAINAQEGEEIFSGYSISGTPKILEGAPGVSRQADVLSGYGVASFNPTVWPFESNVEALSQHVVTSIHGETFSESMTYAIYRMRLLQGVVGTTELVNDACFDNLDTDIASQLWQVARLMQNRDGFEAKRDVFYTQIGGFDTHSDNGPALLGLLKQIDDAIGCFKLEMDTQNIWNNVTIVSASEFGRTLTSNGLGTDHAWGGNHFILGGSVKGGVIHGQFPDDLTDQGNLNIGRGRLIPTTPWEGVWNGMAEWFGVTSQNIEAVLPNLQNFESNIFSKADLFVPE